MAAFVAKQMVGNKLSAVKDVLEKSTKCKNGGGRRKERSNQIKAPVPVASENRQCLSKPGRSDDGESELVPIGKGFAKVPLRILNKLPSMYYTLATRALMSAVFTREEMATHTLSGRPSPAFPDYPVKSQLDPRIIEDVISTVVKYCDSAESIVRAAVTTKCADETKMYRNRQVKRRSKKENIPPSSSESESSSGSEYEECV